MKTHICECLEGGSGFPLRTESDNSHKGQQGGLSLHVTEAATFMLLETHLWKMSMRH